MSNKLSPDQNIILMNMEKLEFIKKIAVNPTMDYILTFGNAKDIHDELIRLIGDNSYNDFTNLIQLLNVFLQTETDKIATYYIYLEKAYSNATGWLQLELQMYIDYHSTIRDMTKTIIKQINDYTAK